MIFPTCANTGTCIDATCNERGRSLAIGGVLVDLTLWFWTSTGQGTLPIRLLREFSDGRSPRAYEDDPEVWVRCVHVPLF